MATALFTGALNGVAGVLLMTQSKYIHSDKMNLYKMRVSVQSCLLVIVVTLFLFSNKINDFFINQYLG